MRRAVCSGTFDPVTLGHLDIFTRTAALFDEVIVAVGVNPEKTRLFSDTERIELVAASVAHLDNVTVRGFSGLIVDFCRDVEATAIVKGLRNGSDFDYELPMAHLNHDMTDVETVFLATDANLSAISSSLVKVIAASGRDVSGYVPAVVAARLRERLLDS